MTNRVVVPSSPVDRKELNIMLQEITHSMQRIDDEREAKKEIVARAAEKFNIPKKIINKLASTMYKRDYEDAKAEHEDFEILYETLVSTDK